MVTINQKIRKQGRHFYLTIPPELIQEGHLEVNRLYEVKIKTVEKVEKNDTQGEVIRREGKYIIVDPDWILTEKAKKMFKEREEAK